MTNIVTSSIAAQPPKTKGKRSVVAPSATCSSWIEVDDTNPASVPETFGHFLVATDSGLVTESFYVPDLKHFAGRPVPARKWNGKYSRRFEAAQRGYKITHWMPLPPHPKNNNQLRP